jgi:uncharacterized membrane protein (DUF485 family)
MKERIYKILTLVGYIALIVLIAYNFSILFHHASIV